MIRRVVEYVVCCDVPDCYDSTAFGSPTAADCEEQALQHGWLKVSARKWLCLDCAQKARDEATRSESV